MIIFEQKCNDTSAIGGGVKDMETLLSKKQILKKMSSDTVKTTTIIEHSESYLNAFEGKQFSKEYGVGT